MSDKEKKIVDSENIILEEYLKSGIFNSKFWLSFIFIFISIIIFVIFKFCVFNKPITSEVLKSSIQISGISSEWIMKKKVNKDDFKGIILVPYISFHVKNIGEKDLEHVFFLGVFRFVNSRRFIGDNFKMALEQPLKPGQLSNKIELSAGLGYSASSKEAFEQDRRGWETSLVELYIKSKNSKLIFLKSLYISKKIKGMNINVRIQ